MRIISGTLKGKKILLPVDKSTRPLKDLTKESIFNIINHSNLININIKNANILDLFSGVGSFGLECLSRGSTSVVFFENYSNVLPLLKKNITNLNLIKQTEIIEKNILDINSFNFLNKKFDIIFLDPPFKEENISSLIERIVDLDLLKKSSIFIIHRHKKKIDKYPKNLNIIIEKFYGISRIIFANFL